MLAGDAAVCTRSGPATLLISRSRIRQTGILVVDGAALVTGTMAAKVLVAGTIVVDNRYLAVWVRERGAWKFVAYQPTPIIKG
jgi:hypothetical protein